MNNICFIPAKGNSKRLPGKNKKHLRGKPLVLYTIEAALESKCFNKVIVSSNDVEIVEIANIAGALGVYRDEKFCSDEIRAKDVVWDFLNKEFQGYDYVALLMPTTPLRNKKNIRDAFSKLKKLGHTSIVSVCEYDFNPGLAIDIDNDRIVSFFNKNYEWVREDQYNVGYHLNGGIYIAQYDFFMENKTFIGVDTGALVMNREESIDIDTVEDFRMAEAIINYKS